MEKIPFSLSFYRYPLIPIFEVKYECADINSQPFLLYHAAMLIEKAKKFKGCPREPLNSDQATANITIKLAFIFPSEDEMDQFYEYYLRG